MGQLIAASTVARARGIRCLLLSALALISGCATLPPEICEQFEQARETIDYDTRYAYSSAETKRAEKSFLRRPSRGAASAGWYTLRVNRSKARACEHLYLIKDLYLQRSGEALTLEEQREFYTAQGRLIATKREDLTEQLSKSGYYTASVPLPIPRGAPAGGYRVVTHLIATSAQGRSRTLATATGEFRVQ
jgi:hypothetical protein